jgi:hypothetical protein
MMKLGECVGERESENRLIDDLLMVKNIVKLDYIYLT